MNGASVRITARPLWAVRAVARALRVAVAVVSICGCAAAVRIVIAGPEAPMAQHVAAPADDLGQQAYAALFARRYLSWNAASPDLHEQGLAMFTQGGVDPDAGVVAPTSGSQQVLWTSVLQSRAGVGGEQVYTVAVDTDASGLEYLAVPVIRARNGALAIGGYPAFVGPPVVGPFTDASGSLPQVADPTLQVVVTRALGNYLAGATSNLAADLAAAARVSPPSTPLTLRGVTSLRWSAADESVLAQVVAGDAQGASYSLTYEIGVARQQSRWEVTAIEVDPAA